MRFRKRIKVVKGLHVNLSGSGVSLSAGVRGASITIGKKEAYLNTGIPGTGLYDRRRIGSSRKTASSSSYRDSNSNDSQKVYVNVSLDDKGRPIMKATDSLGLEITDESIIRKLKRGDQYKKSVEQLMNEKREEVENSLKGFIEIYKSTPGLLKEKDIRETLGSLAPEKYTKEEFSKQQPSIESIKSTLQDEAKNRINSILFWRNKKNREEYVNNNIHTRYSESVDKWLKERDEFDLGQNRIETEQNSEFSKQFTEMKNALENYLEGSDEFVNKSVEILLSEIALPVDFSIDYEYDKAKSFLYIDLDLPEIEDMPEGKVYTLASGMISIKKKTQMELRREYALCVCGIAFYFSGLFFNVTSNIKKIQISGYTQRLDKKTGHTEDEYVYSVKFDRQTFESLNIDQIDPMEAIDNFDRRMNITSIFELRKIEPFGID